MSSTPDFFPGLPVLAQSQVALASASPRRRELLGRLMPPDRFVVVAANLDESRLHGESPADYVVRLAAAKARKGAELWLASHPAPGPKLVLAADTSVVLGDAIYGKPETAPEARRMLRELSGKTHEVLTGFAAYLLDATHQPLKQASTYCTTEVDIRPLSDAEIDWYVKTGEPLDKAGGYAIQGYGGTLIGAIRGDYYNVVGLPLVPLIQMLSAF